jgi:hypothetical protein
MILNRTRRERVDMTRYMGRTVPATKTGGGCTTYTPGAAVYEWCLFEWRGDTVFWLLDDSPPMELSISNCQGGAAGVELDAEETARLHREAATFTDVSETVFEHLIEAERLATVDDFIGTTFDMGNPIGYIQRLHHVWTTRAAKKL